MGKCIQNASGKMEQNINLNGTFFLGETSVFLGYQGPQNHELDAIVVGPPYYITLILLYLLPKK